MAPDFENPTDVGEDNHYQVTVRVSDGALADLQAIMVAVTDVEKPPVKGSSGKDVLIGRNGHDTINGGLGNDTLTGGGGEDAFQFTSKLGKKNIDHVTDFTSSADTIELGHLIFKKLAHAGLPTELSASEFRVGAHPKDVDDHLIYNSKHGRLYYDHDGKGGDVKVLFALLDSHPNLTEADFLIV